VRRLGVLCTPFAAGALLLHTAVGALPVGERAVPAGVLCTPFAAGALLLHPSVGALPVGEGLFPGRALHAVRSGGAAPTHRCGALPAGGRAVPWACFARRSQRGRCSYRPLWEPRPRGEWRAARARSVVLEVRLALLDEGLHALGLVGGGEDRVE